MTTTPAGDDIVPRFIEGRAGRLFVTYFPPATAVNPKRAVIFVPPFAEEMNRWRPMAARMARQLAQIGWGAALVDLLGTGDSEGDFAEASWDIWRNDVRAASDWLCGRGVERQALLGLRLGGLLALDCAADLAGRLDRVILWQPVLRGAVMMTQFLRIRLAAGMNAAGGEKETTASLRTRLADRETIEVAGYALTGALTQAIDELDLARLGAGCRLPIDWLEIEGGGEGGISTASQRVVAGWRQSGVTVSARAVDGESFWAMQEITLAPQLIAATRAVFADQP